MTDTKDIMSAKRTIEKEIEALKMMENEFDDNLTKALDLLQNTKGRVIVTGMGKSGHVGRKISATFASTGTPSFFVHPGEASHGDLGMLTKDDVVIAISNGGLQQTFWHSVDCHHQKPAKLSWQSRRYYSKTA